METKEPARPKRKQQPKRKGGCLGHLFFLLIGLAAGAAGLHVYQNGFEQSMEDLKELFEKEEEPVAYRPAQEGRVIDATQPMDLRPLHEQDPRWEQAITDGEQGVALFELAVREHYGDDGDPFQLRARMGEAQDLMEGALKDLRAMREEYGSNKTAVVEIDKKIRRYSGSLAEYDPKTR
ncbi:MAG: hypothetical protein ACYSU1_00080 [Planctomycetota bacterium]|jgi:hypothetical protein